MVTIKLTANYHSQIGRHAYILINLREPAWKTIEALLVRQRVHQHDRHGIFVVQVLQRLESFFTGRVPNLKTNYLLVGKIVRAVPSK